MDFSIFGDLLSSTGSSGLDGAFSGVGSDFGGNLASNVGVGDAAGLTGAQFAGDSVGSIAGQSSQSLITGAGVDQGLSGGAGAGSLSGLTGSDVVSQFGGAGGGSGSNFLNSLGPAAQKAANMPRFTPRLNTSEFPLPGHMYMRAHETPDPKQSKAVQSADPMDIWKKWYTQMNTLVYKGR